MKLKDTPFSRFIRLATDEEKERVYLDVMERADELQREVLRKAEKKSSGEVKE